MGFILGQLRQLGMVALIMLCALGGTVGLLKLIRQFMPGGQFPKDPITKKPESRQDKKE